MPFLPLEHPCCQHVLDHTDGWSLVSRTAALETKNQSPANTPRGTPLPAGSSMAQQYLAGFIQLKVGRLLRHIDARSCVIALRSHYRLTPRAEYVCIGLLPQTATRRYAHCTRLVPQSRGPHSLGTVPTQATMPSETISRRRRSKRNASRGSEKTFLVPCSNCPPNSAVRLLLVV